MVNTGLRVWSHRWVDDPYLVELFLCYEAVKGHLHVMLREDCFESGWVIAQPTYGARVLAFEFVTPATETSNNHNIVKQLIQLYNQV